MAKKEFPPISSDIIIEQIRLVQTPWPLHKGLKDSEQFAYPHLIYEHLSLADELLVRTSFPICVPHCIMLTSRIRDAQWRDLNPEQKNLIMSGPRFDQNIRWISLPLPHFLYLEHHGKKGLHKLGELYDINAVINGVWLLKESAHNIQGMKQTLAKMLQKGIIIEGEYKRPKNEKRLHQNQEVSSSNFIKDRWQN